jgi:hypothetical protein
MSCRSRPMAAAQVSPLEGSGWTPYRAARRIRTQGTATAASCRSPTAHVTITACASTAGVPKWQGPDAPDTRTGYRSG